MKKLDYTTIFRHKKICESCGLELVSEIYYSKNHHTPFQRKIDSRVLPIYKELQAFVRKHETISVRQFFYHCISIGLVRFPRTAKDAKNIYQNLDNDITRCRLAGIIPIDSITDETVLWGTTQYDSIKEPIRHSIISYRSKWWKNQKYYVEAWLEKRALENTLFSITENYGVYLSVAGGYPTLSQIISAIERFQEYLDKEIVILYFGDLDPSGKDMPRYLGERLEELGVDNVTIKEIALTKDDVAKYNLPKNPSKPKDTRNDWYIKKYGITYAVELDALEPDILRSKVESAILAYTNLDLLKKARKMDMEQQMKWVGILG